MALLAALPEVRARRRYVCVRINRGARARVQGPADQILRRMALETIDDYERLLRCKKLLKA